MGLGRDGKQHKGHTNKEALKGLVYGYLQEPDRLELKKWLRAHKMQQRTFYKLEGEYLAEKKRLGKEGAEVKKRELKGVVMDAWGRLEGKEPPKRIKGMAISDITDDEKLTLARKVYEDAMKIDASTTAKELAVRMLGMLIEKKETTVKIDGAVIITAISEAERERRNQGDMEVSEELSPLPPELRLDTGQSRARND